MATALGVEATRPSPEVALLSPAPEPPLVPVPLASELALSWSSRLAAGDGVVPGPALTPPLPAVVPGPEPPPEASLAELLPALVPVLLPPLLASGGGGGGGVGVGVGGGGGGGGTGGGGTSLERPLAHLLQLPRGEASGRSKRAKQGVLGKNT